MTQPIPRQPTSVSGLHAPEHTFWAGARSTRRILSLLLGAVALVLIPASANAQQEVFGRVVDGGSGVPLQGAMVVLLDGERVAGQVLTSDGGAFRIAVREPGRYELRVDRIGYSSTYTEVFTVALGASVERTVETTVQAIGLPGIQVEGAPRCEVRPEGAGVAILWEEARKALAAATWTAERGLYRFLWTHFVRELGPDGRLVLSEARDTRVALSPQPFLGVSAATLAEEGFLYDPGNGLHYAAPDAAILLSDDFLDTHCFGLTAQEVNGESLLGLRFEPIQGRLLPDVEGVLWLGARTGRLRSVEYQYVNLPWRVDASSAGGDVHFRGLPNGTWVVTDWRIRVPRLTEERTSNGITVLGYRVLGYREEGGAVDVVATMGGEAVDRSADRGAVRGVVSDSLGRPAGGGRAWIEGTDYEVTTAADGSFQFAGVGPGTWSVGATHPALQAVGHRGFFREVEVSQGGVGTVRMELPSRYGAALELCSEDSASRGTILVGRVLNAANSPTAGAAVRVIWRAVGAALDIAGMPIERSTTWEGLGTETNQDGRFRLCGLPESGALWVSAGSGESSSELIEVATAGANSLASLDIALSPAVGAREPSTLPGPSGADGAWLTSKGFQLRADGALLHQTGAEISALSLTNIERILRQIPRVEVVRRADGRSEYRLHAAADWTTRTDSPPPCLLQFFLNGSLVRANVPTAMIDYSNPAVAGLSDLRPLDLDRWLEAYLVSGTEVFDAENAPVVIPGGCGAALIWARHLEDTDDPEFRGRLSGRVVRVPEGLPVVGVRVRLEPGAVELETDAFGRFDFGRLPPARYRVEVTVPEWGTWATEVMLRSTGLADVRIEIEGAPAIPDAPPRLPMPGR